MLIEEMSTEQFYDFWGHHNQRKYNVLNDLLVSVKLVKEKYQEEDDFIAMQKWANDVDLKNLNNDVVGKIVNVSVATIQHLRMDFGIDTVKPDQRVVEVIEREFLNKRTSQKRAISFVEKLSSYSGLKTRLIDMILVNYGSGYYANNKYYSKYGTQVEIAKKLLEKKVDLQTISFATGLGKETLKTLLNKEKPVGNNGYI